MKLFTLLFFFLVTAHAQIKPVDQQYMSGENYLLNNGFESGRASWTQAGTATATLEQSVVRFGVQSYKIVASSQTVDLSQVVTKYAAQSGGQQGIVSVFIKNTNPLLKVCAVSNSVDTNCLDVLPNDEWREYAIPFVLSATNNGIRIKSASDSGTTYIDNAFVGVMPATMMPEVSQAQFLGRLNYATATGCVYSITGTTITNFSADTDCATPTVTSSSIKAPSTKIPAVVLPAGSQAGTYKFVATGFFYGSSSSDSLCSYRFSDGTNNTSLQTGGNATNSGGGSPVIHGEITYSGALNADTTINIQSREDSGNAAACTIELNDNQEELSISVYYYPPKSKIYSGDTIYPHAQLYGTLTYANAANCNFSITGTTFVNFGADTDCVNPTVTGNLIAPSTKIPAFILPAGAPKGTYQIAASSFFFVNAGANGACYFRLSDGTNNTTATSFGNTSTISSYNPYVVGTIDYQSALPSNTTIQIQAREMEGNANSCDIQVGSPNSISDLKFEVYYFPPKDNPIIGTFAGIEKCADDFECTDTYSAKNTLAGNALFDLNVSGWATTSSCSSGNNSITFKTALFTVAPNCQVNYIAPSGNWFSIRNVVSSNTGLTFTTVDNAGTPVCTSYVVSCQKQGSDYKPKTAKAATTNEMMYVPNVTRPKTCYYAFGGAGSLTAPTNCTTGTCIEYYDSCSAGSPPTKGSAGEYNDLIFTNGTWKNTTPILCKLSAFNTTTAAGRFTSSFFITGDNTITTNSNGGYTLNLYAQTPAGGGGDSYWLLECTADAP